jgi:hypothetical protein
MLTFLSVLFKAREADRLPAFSAGRYSGEWADRLYRGIARNLSSPFRFICLVDEQPWTFTEPIEPVPLLDPTEAWMSLNEVYRPDLGVEHGIFMGLDTVITGSLDDLAALDIPLGMPRDPFAIREPCNALVVFDAGSAEKLWRTWDGNRELFRRECRIFDRPSEMVFLRRVGREMDFRYLDDLLPGQLASYKCHVRADPKAALERARIVYFHGWPKPCDLKPDDPCRLAWEAP